MLGFLTEWRSDQVSKPSTDNELQLFFFLLFTNKKYFLCIRLCSKIEKKKEYEAKMSIILAYFLYLKHDIKQELFEVKCPTLLQRVYKSHP